MYSKRLYASSININNFSRSFKPASELVGFPGGTNGKKNLPANAGDARDAGSIPGSRKSPGEVHGNPFQYLCLENPGAEDPGGLQTLGHTESDSTETT